MKRGMLTAVFFGVVYGLMAAEEGPPTPAAPAASAGPAPGKPKIRFEQTLYDFGKTSQVDHVSGTFKFQNVGYGVLKLGRPTTSCGCTVAGVKPEVLQPGETGELSFTLNLGRSKAVLHKQITVESNDPDNPKTVLNIKADYTPLYEISPPSFFFTLRKGNATNLVARVVRTDGKPFQVTKVKPTRPWIEAKAEQDGNEAVRILATLNPDGSPGYFSDFVNVFVDDSDQPAFMVTISGRLLGDLVLSPESLYWPISEPTKALTVRRIMVRSSLPDKLEVKNVSTTLQGLNLETVTREDGKTTEVVAKLASIPDRTTNGVIRFETNVPSQPRVEVPVWINVIPAPAKK